MPTVKAGVLALQGDFREHAVALASVGASPVEVRTPADLAGVDLLVLPGGESTTMGLLARAGGLVDPIRERIAAGLPVLGTCAGMIVLAERVDGGDPLFGVLDITVRRNAYGRQVDSFEADVDVRGIDHPVRGVFIRAPRVEDVGAGVVVLAEHEGHPVVLEQGNIVVASFHPELVGDIALHAYVLGKV
ncbi:MAG: pyridoxal 5'-phosphate synthase glutaminase subunit PdxT [Actinomycetota bacterium]